MNKRISKHKEINLNAPNNQRVQPTPKGQAEEMVGAEHVKMLPQPNNVVWKGVVNGQPVETLVASNAVLLDVLRDKVGMLGVKRGCDLGTCGCCTVMVDGQPQLSCLTFAGQCNGKEITTVEGLAHHGHLAPIQECFATYGGSQCGFCTPGFLISSQALLNQNSEPTRAEIACAIEGNLCRCTGYQQIIDAVEAAASMHRGETKQAPKASDPHPDPHPMGPDEPSMPPGNAR